MPCYPELKIVGWTSSYKSVQKALDKLKKDKANDEEYVSFFLDSILGLCVTSGKNPDDIVALEKSRRFEARARCMDAFSAFMKKQNISDDERNHRMACVINFLGWNKAF